MQLNDGTVLNSPEEIYLGATIYFQNFLVDNSNVEHADLFHMLESVVSEEENSALCHPQSMEEVKDTIFSILRYSAQGPDGFGSKFCMVCWKVIKEDVLEVVQDFFKGSLLPRFYTSFYIVLIPGVKNPKSFDKFRPISLCSVATPVAYKICSKLLVKRMIQLLSLMISPKQGTFIPSRSIFENITLVQEMVQSLN